MKNRLDPLQLIWISFAICTLVAVAMTVQTIGLHRRQRGWLDARIEDLNTLARIERDMAGQRAALHTLERMESTELSPISQVITESRIDSEYEFDMGGTEEVSSDWHLRQGTVVFDRIPAGELFELVSELQARRPPWRVVGINVQALPNEYGELRASLHIEGLEKR